MPRMPFIGNVHLNQSIALRIALVSWGVSLVTLLVIVTITIPQQTEVFLKNLESKARGITVSLGDVAAGAAVNEDYASLVNTSQTLLRGDSEITFLVVNKNDGFALISEPSGWRVEAGINGYWQPQERRSAGRIGSVPLLDLRTFHYAHPFDYTGIEWGWIHVGLSLESYDQNVARLYRSTAWLALGCILLSLLVSLLYARALVKPIKRLRSLVHQIATGDLSVRVEIPRQDELGQLGASVNTMAEALCQRDRLLQGVSGALQELLSAPDLQVAIPKALAIVGEAANQDRAYFFHYRFTPETDEHLTSQVHEWVKAGIAPQAAPQRSAALFERSFPEWLAPLRRGEPVSGFVSDLPDSDREILRAQGVVSILILPVMVNDALFGCIGFDNCARAHDWTDSERAILASLASSMGAAVERYQAEQAVLEAKSTLELRVQERTGELRAQVAAKEQALTDLAAAQSELVAVSRTAGMAEVATGVLHNVGNVLNSVNVSANVIMAQLRESRVGNLAKVAELMAAPDGGIGRFMSEDPRGQKIPLYLSGLAKVLEEEHARLLTESSALHERIDHIKEIVAMQQTYGRVMGVMETLPPTQLMEDALKLNAESLAEHGIAVVREYAEVPPMTVDKHKVLQILLNLISNARNASAGENWSSRLITLRVYPGGKLRVRLEVADLGVGIDADNMTRIFQHGFTTRKDGHGFGLHSGALAAREMGGSLSARSDGLGKGATFTLELPLSPEERV